MRNALVLTGIFLAALLMSLPALGALTPQATHGKMHGPMPKPKNLQVLPKNISHAQLMKVMHGFAGSLGVKCSFCHAAGTSPHHLDFASDAKPQKRIARTMMRMTHEIDTKYMSQVNVPDSKPGQNHVTCGTCHRGHAKPAVFVLPPEHQHGGPPPAQAETRE